mmetsp:Transcript_1155/g.1586  ORF Transcript_1155/g.1586 Transcript_1155/m.1586 type:complete len:283 (+) Transcript_1155:130-978(+)
MSGTLAIPPSNVHSTLLEIIHNEFRCELAGLPTNITGTNTARLPSEQLINMNATSEKIYQFKDIFPEEDPETEDFLMMYLDVLKGCRTELERMDAMIDEFCTTYLDALKPTTTPQTANGGPSNPLSASNSLTESQQWDDKGESSDDASASPEAPMMVGMKRKGSIHDELQGEHNADHKRRGNLPKAATNLLKKWIFDHLFHPYPTEEEKTTLSIQTGLSLNQISNWFINARRRILQPMLESVRQQQQMQGLDPIPLPQPKPQRPKSSKKGGNGQASNGIPDA